MEVVVVGAGLMGSQIAAEYALGGHRVHCLARHPEATRTRVVVIGAEYPEGSRGHGEIYDPLANAWSPFDAPGAMDTATALLPNGSVFVAQNDTIFDPTSKATSAGAAYPSDADEAGKSANVSENDCAQICVDGESTDTAPPMLVAWRAKNWFGLSISNTKSP